MAKEILTVARNNIYYIGDSFNHFKVANKKNLVDIYAKKEKEIQLYVKDHKVDFTNEENIKALLEYITTTSN